MKKSLWILILGAIAVGGTTVDRAERMGPTESPLSRTSEQGKTATLAGGCFWCMEEPFEKLDGVTAVISGYAGGDEEDPSYRQVSAGGTGHAEAVQVHYDPDRITYEGLLEVFWMQINPTDAGGQFVDRGTQYRTEIFYHDDRQKVIAEKSRVALGESGRYEKPIVTPITPLTRFFPAEEYHQDYYKKNPVGYHQYRSGSGRDQYLDKIWGDERNGSHASTRGVAEYRKPSGGELRAILTSLQYRVTQEEGTEPPFRNEHWDNNAEGIYVDIVSGEPLFSSRDKYKSGTGWPSFTRPLVGDSIVQKEDHRLFQIRTELRSKHADSHLGHLFQDGPAPTGLRYCINSASLRFIPREELEAEGFGEFLHLFEK